MTSRVINLRGRGARGESEADILRRTGAFGVLPTDSDLEAELKKNAVAIEAKEGAELARDQASDLVSAQNRFVAVDLNTARVEGEAATTEGTYFLAVGEAEGLAEVRRRTDTSSELIYTEVTRTRLNSPAGASEIGSERDVPVQNTLLGIPTVAVVELGGKEDSTNNDGPQLRDALAFYSDRVITSVNPARILTDQGGDFEFGAVGSVGTVWYGALLDQSNLTISGKLRVRGRGVAGTYVEPIISTPRNSAAGTYTNVTFREAQIDLDDTGNTASTNQRGVYLTCIDNLTLDTVTFFTSTNRRGYGAHLHNLRDAMLCNVRQSRTTGGLNLRYFSGLLINGGVFSNFSESIDLDGIGDTAVLANMVFRSTANTNQCVDLNSVVGGVLANVAAHNVGNLYTINYKDTSQTTYTGYLNNDPPTAYTPSSNIVVANLVARDAAQGSNTASVIIGTDFTTGYSEGPVKRITLANQILENINWIHVTGCEDLIMSNMILKNVSSPASNQFGAISLRPDTVSSGSQFNVTADLTNVSIDGCQRTALRVAASPRLRINGLRVRNADTSGSGDRAVNISAVPAGAVYSIDGLDVEGDVQLNVVDATARILWGKNNRVSGSLILQAEAHRALKGETEQLYIGDVVAGSNAKRTWLANRKCKVVFGGFRVSANVAASGTDNAIARFSSTIGGAVSTVAFGSSAAGWSANTMIDGGFAASETAVDLNPGDTIEFDISHTGAGRALSDLVACIEVIYL